MEENSPFKPVVYNVWSDFIAGKDLEPESVREIILDSWKRCYEYGVDPLKGKGACISDKQLEEIRLKCNNLIDIAKPFMYEIHNFVKESGFVVVLTDKNGFILEVVGDPNIIENAQNLGFVKGAFWSEEKVGTNAIGTALEVDKPLQVVAEEHFCKDHHSWTCSAAPIHDKKGELIGVLDMSGPCELVHPHTLGIVVAAVKAIENHLRIEEQKNQLQVANEFSQTVLNSISEGLISIDQEGYLVKVNNTAKRILDLEEMDLKGKKVTEVLGNEVKILDVLEQRKGYTDQEVVICRGDKRIRVTSTAQPIINQNGEIIGVVSTFKKLEVVQNLVNRMVGSQANFTFKDIIGESLALQEAKRLSRLASRNFSNILLLGESGTGKELFAQSMHNYGDHCRGPFVSINCAAIPQSLLESELFGYEEGAFTGAQSKGRPGKFELANGGTLFLDEISEMSLQMQASLLRVLQEREVVRIGGSKAIPIDVNIVAASNRDLEQEVEEGNFRRDLFFRLNTFSIELPPLRERIEDIPLLVDYFLQKFSSKLGDKKISAKALKLLQSYNWSGNIRELENIIQRGIVLAEDSNQITVNQLPEKLLKHESIVENNEGHKVPLMSLEEVERRVIKEALAKTENNISQAAQLLDIGRSTLYRKINKYKLS
ncbi:sigma-54-dependent Fis family transcriptional regulator [Natroniella acetigena]|uniref:sigma-54-dependent Fis family transcriptional regulator n=1 Tax=Natroniella acetigena TaxID=52004 RepID=UPI00200A4F30|nr:sigma-54-dependent Fis family transcriptional regulator [Natroniella acetigena]MCK8827070.1 sigma-54-dependent Fis family transcriptional regulator [Natroniella acetigena]